jgi:hypothetical protein
MKNFLNQILYAIYLYYKGTKPDNKRNYNTAKNSFVLLLFLCIMPISLLLVSDANSGLFESRSFVFLLMLPFYFLLSRFTMDYETMINHKFSDEEIAQGNDWLGMLMLLMVVLFMISIAVK